MYTEKELLDKIEDFRPKNDNFKPLEILFNSLNTSVRISYICSKDNLV